MSIQALSRALACVVALTLLTSCESLPLRARSVQCNVAVVITGGASCEPMDRMAVAKDEEAKRFAVDSEKAHLYIVRPSIVGGRYAWTVQVDGRAIGAVAEHTFLLVTLKPGRHEVAVQTAENRHAVVVDLVAGENRFIEVVSRMGWTQSKAEARIIERGPGESAVLESSRVDALEVD